jgi:hypothetical protein
MFDGHQAVPVITMFLSGNSGWLDSMQGDFDERHGIAAGHPG